MPRPDPDLARDVGVVEMGVGGLDREPPAVGHRVAGVDGEVEDRVLELVGVAEGQPQAAGHHHLELHPLAERPAQQLVHRADQPVGVDRPRLERLAPGEGQQPVGQRGGALGRGHGEAGIAGQVLRPALVDAGLHQVERADDAGEQVVEVVGDAPGELAHRLHLLRLAQRLLDPGPLLHLGGQARIGLGERRRALGHLRFQHLAVPRQGLAGPTWSSMSVQVPNQRSIAPVRGSRIGIARPSTQR